MEKLTLAWITQATHGKLRGKHDKKLARGVSTDSRTIQPGEIFIALQGEHFDGHEFVGAAERHRAAAAIVCRNWAAVAQTNLPLIIVANTLVALQRFAKMYRRQRKDFRVIAVTGSSGKTTTKEMIAAVMSKQYRVIKSSGNLNNHIGVPLSVLQTNQSDEVGVFELGINHPGELKPLVEICQPQIGVVTNIGPSHLEFFGDEEGVMKEKGVLVEKLPPNGLAILNADDPWTENLSLRTDSRVTKVGFATEADVRADNVHWKHGKLCFDLHFSEEEKVPQVWLDAVGKHQIYSALYAAAVAREFGLDGQTIATALVHCQPIEGRMQVEKIGGIRLVNDTYNANPDSMRAALEALASWPQARRRIALLGDMHELGPASADAHQAIGTIAAQLRLDQLLVVGDQARLIGEQAQHDGLKKEQVRFFSQVSDAGAALAQLALPGDAILVKASRASRLEEAIKLFRHQLGAKRKRR